MKVRRLSIGISLALAALLAGALSFAPALGQEGPERRNRQDRENRQARPDRPDRQAPARRNPAPPPTARDLLDRGGAPRPGAPGFKTHTGLMTNTLANGLGTPGVTIGAIMTAAPAAPVGVFHGYFFTPGVSFPTSYHPFFVTGAYVWVAPPIFASPIVGAGAAMAVGAMVGAFAAVPVPAGVFSPGMIFGGMTLFPHSPPAVSVPAGFGVACGFDPAVAGPVLGGLTPGTGGGKPVVAFAPGATVTPIAAPPATYVAGCFIAGATVPVELQSFEVE